MECDAGTNLNKETFANYSLTPAGRFYFNGSKIGTFIGIVLSDFVTGEGNYYAVSIIEDAEESNAYWFLYHHADALLKPNTSYILVIPKNIFKVTENQNLEEVRITVTTGDYEEEELLHRSSVIRWHEFTGNWVRTGENTIACLMGDEWPAALVLLGVWQCRK